MPGFYISNNVSITLNNCISEELIHSIYTVKRNTLNRFLNDKAFYQDDECIIITEGVILNKTQLLAKYGINELSMLVKQMYKVRGETFFNDFRGSFSGAYYNDNNDEWIIYTNHYGDNALFYYWDGQLFIVGSQVNYILDALHCKEIEYSLNEKAVYYMMTYGSMEDDSTYANEIKRLMPGHYIKIKNNSFDVAEYYMLKRDKIDISKKTEEEIIDEMNNLFRAAVKLEYEKDREYGYRHIADLSGGLDSRMAVWVAHDLGYTDVLNLTFCQSNYTDETVAKQIAAHLGNEIILRTLDDVDLYVQMNYGLSLYSGATGGVRLTDDINIGKYGVKHSGQIGDVVIGTFLNSPTDLFKEEIAGAYSMCLVDRLAGDGYKRYPNREVYLIYVRGFIGCLSSHFMLRNYTEIASPFLNVELMDYCLSIPLELRCKHKLYKKWILTKYPKAGDFVWEKMGAKILTPEWKLFLKKVIERGPRKILRVMGINFRENKNNGMNPMDFWHEKKPELREFMKEYFDGNIVNPRITNKMRADMTMLFNNGGVGEKTQVMTALSAIENYWN